MTDLLFYGTETGKVYGPYHQDEFRARAFIVARLQDAGHEVYVIDAATYEQARRRLAARKR